MDARVKDIVLDFLSEGNEKEVVIDLNKVLMLYGEDVAKHISDMPDRFLDSIEEVAKTIGREDCNVSIVNAFYDIDAKKIPPELVGKLVTVEGIVRVIGHPHGQLVVATYECPHCGETISAFPRGKIPQQIKCDCGGTMYLCPEKSRWKNVQEGELQDMKDLNAKINFRLYNHHVKRITAGEVVKITGILRVSAPNKSGLGKYYIDVVGFEKKSASLEEVTIDSEDLKRIYKIARGNPMEWFKQAFAGVFGYDEIKEALILQLFGGVKKKRGLNKVRGNIHILLLGDPATAKSQMISIVNEIAPISIYVCGKTSTGVGLTATVERSEAGDWLVKAGAVVLASGGICCIDEFEKMDVKDKQSLLEAMEQQTISLAKASVVATLPAETSILAAANPKYGKFDDYEEVIKQINIDPPLLSRFDLIFVIKDKADEELDKKIAERILSEVDCGDFDVELMRKYVAYAKRIKPQWSEEAKNTLARYYVSLRQTHGGKMNITARELESLVRLAEAHARLHLRNKITDEDVAKAIALKEYSVKQITGGKMDIGIIYTGMDEHERQLYMQIDRYIEEVIEFDVDELVKEFGEENRDLIERYVQLLKQDGAIIPLRDGRYKLNPARLL